MDSDNIEDGFVGRPQAGIKIKVTRDTIISIVTSYYCIQRKLLLTYHYVQIVSLETGKCVGPNTEGEIYIKSKS